MEAHNVEAGSMSIFWTQNCALKTTSFARVPARAWWELVGPSGGAQIGFGGTRWVLALLYVGPKSGSVGRGGTRWVPAPSLRGDPTPRLCFTMLIRVRGGPMMAIFTAL